MRPRLEFVSVSYEVIAGGRTQEVPSYEEAIQKAFAAMDMMVGNGISLEEAGAAVQVIEKRELRLSSNDRP